MQLNDERYSSADLDAVLELRQSPGFALVTRRIEDELERRRNALEKPGDVEGTAHLRGYIEALRIILRVPQTLEDEIRGWL